MARVLLAWELGAGFGHLVSLRALARDLAGRGHECVFGVRQLGSAQQFLEPELGMVLQAPVRLGAGKRPVKTPVSYTSLLHNVGFDDPVELAGRIAAWRNLMIGLKIAYVYADHSPLAVIAARTLDLPVCHLGSGFLVPPLHKPFPSFRPAMKIPPDVLAHNDAEVLKELNTALQLLRLPPLAALQDMFSGATPALLTYRELDHYEVPRAEPYLGMPDYSHGESPRWPDGAGPRIFVYLRRSPNLAAVLDALSKVKARVLALIPDLAPQAVSRFRRPGWSVAEQPVDFRQAATQADAFVNYGAISTVSEFLLAGKPGLLLPMHQEQVLTTRRAVSLGACLAARGKDVGGLVSVVERLLQDTALRQSADGFAARYRGQDRSRILPDLVTRTLG